MDQQIPCEQQEKTERQDCVSNTETLTDDEKTFGMLCHLGALAGIVIPCGSIVVPLVIWLMKRDSSDFVNRQGIASLNYQITLLAATLAAALVSLILTVVVVGVLLLFLLPFAVIFLTVVPPILSGLAASKGMERPYPYAYPFLK